jgi:AraC-like DNA-binding protein
MSNIVNDFPPVAVDSSQPYDRIRELYLYEEPALLTAIRRGDRREATRIINLILVHIYSTGEERSELLKGLLLELVVMMSRAAVEVGASQSEVLGLRYRHLTELAAITDDEQLAHWLREALLRIFDAVDRCRAFDVPQLVRKVLETIRAGAGGALTREQVARQAGVSPAHLAHLLKERTGRSFTDLVREARIERASEMLRNTEHTIAAIALDSGFCDQSYFTRVFQNLKKTTPKQYRDAGQHRAPHPPSGSP